MTEEEVQQQSIGHQLTEARDKKKLTRDDVASQLNLHIKIVTALETDDFENLPPPLFTRGYLRSYAKLVGLDVEPLVDVYNTLGPNDPELSSAYEVSKETQSSHPVVRWATLLIIVTISTLLGFWWYGLRNIDEQNIADSEASVVQQSDTAEASEVVVAEVETSDVIQVVVEQLIPTDEAEAEAEAKVEVEVEVIETQTEQLASVETVVVEPVIESVEAEEAANPTFVSSSVVAVEEVITQVNNAVNNDVAEDTVSTNANVVIDGSNVETESLNAISSHAVESESQSAEINDAAASTEQTNIVVVESIEKISVTRDAVGDDTMLLSTETESWVEVIDTNGARLMYGMLNSERAITLQGSAPFQVFLGNTPGVSIAVNGKTLATPSYNTINNTSRFFVRADGTYRR